MFSRPSPFLENFWEKARPGIPHPQVPQVSLSTAGIAFSIGAMASARIGPDPGPLCCTIDEISRQMGYSLKVKGDDEAAKQTGD